MMTFREQICLEALTWEGTPFHRGALAKGIGGDCVGIAWSIYRGVYGIERWPRYSRPPEPYQNLISQHWHRYTKEELLLGVLRYAMPKLIEVSLPVVCPGDFLCAGAPGEPSNHLAVLLSDDKILHARMDPRGPRTGGRIMVEQRHPAFRKSERAAFRLLPPEEPIHV